MRTSARERAAERALAEARLRFYRDRVLHNIDTCGHVGMRCRDAETKGGRWFERRMGDSMLEIPMGYRASNFYTTSENKYVNLKVHVFHESGTRAKRNRRSQCAPFTTPFAVPFVVAPFALTPLTALAGAATGASRPIALRRMISRRPRTPWRRRSSTGTVWSQEMQASVRRCSSEWSGSSVGGGTHL